MFDSKEIENVKRITDQIFRSLRDIKDYLELRILPPYPLQVSSQQIKSLKKLIQDWVITAQAGEKIFEVEGIVIKTTRLKEPIRIESSPAFEFNPKILESVLSKKARKYKKYDLLISLGIHEWPLKIILPEIEQIVARMSRRICGLLIIQPSWRPSNIRACDYYFILNPKHEDGASTLQLEKARSV